MDRSQFFRRVIAAPLLAAGIGLVTAESCSAQGHSDAELFDRHLLNGACAPYAVPSWAPPPVAPGPYAPTPAEPDLVPPSDEPPPAADVDQVFLPPAQGTLLASASFAGVPSMVGDFFGVGTGVILLSPYDVPYLGINQPPRDPEEPEDPNRPPSNGGGNGGEPEPAPRVVVVPNPGAAGAIVGREKIADNGSPLPRDRVFFNYSYFDNVPLAPGGVDVNRFTPGFEKTFFDGRTSIEMRFPFATTLNNNFLLDGFTNDDELEFGNLMIYTKALLYSSPTTAIGSGLGISVPTADDLNVGLTDGTTLVQVRNESVHLLPYIGGIHAPGDRFFLQGFAQLDYDTNGNPVYLNSPNGLVRAGRLDDTTFLYLDAGAGYWLYRNPARGAGLTGIVPMFELHYNRSLESTDVIEAEPFQVGERLSDIQVLNATFSTTFVVGNDLTFTTAYATPIGNSTDQAFDGEFRLFVNWYFGGPNAALPVLGQFGPAY